MDFETIIIGAGPAGLGVASALSLNKVETLVLEAAPRAGGSVVSYRQDGFLVEGGPNSLMLENDGVEGFLKDIGLVPLEASPVAKKRFLVCGGRPVAAPSGLIGALTTPLLSLRGKLRFLGEPFARSAPAGGDESVGTFVRRRLGREVAQRLVDAMVGGIYAGDIERLSLRSAFPRLHEMEMRYGSLLRAGLSKGRAAPIRRLVNFAEGMAEIPNAMVCALGAGRLQASVRITALGKTPDGWKVSWENGSSQATAKARFLVLAVPPWSWPTLPLPAMLQELLLPWKAIEAPPISIVSLGYKREQVAHPLDGFGMLSPGIEGRKILGTLFQSSLFSKRTPEGCVLLTSFVGGSRQAGLTQANDEEQAERIHGEMRELLGATGTPCFTHICHWPRAIPQYNIGHEALSIRLATAEHRFVGLRFCGNYCAGIALPKTILHALKVASEISAAFGKPSKLKIANV
ncbi:MAG: protoporphyrinogen oxidase [Puniceicoccales bacterium]|jgi:oxygen-dependent protoporphyrinogen oxidase|nr:protoporphyrinogen oxidase [Puniceicoccales bacterium]